MPQVITIPYDGQEIGQGYNSETRESIGTGLNVANISEDPAANGQEVTTIFESVSSQDSLMETLGISASVDVRYGLFSGGAKFDFAQSHAVNSFSSFIAGRSTVHNAMRHGNGFKLNDDAAALVTAQRMDDFKTAFGDMFVRSLKTGGEFDVVARITSVSEEHQSKLAASLHAEYNGLIASGSFQAAFNQAMSETNSRTEVTVFMSQAGGIGGQASFTGPDATKILQRLSDFPASVHDHPVGFEVELASYNTIPIPVPTPEESEDRQIVLQDCFNQKMGFLKALSDFNFLLSENASLFFDNLPSQEELVKIQGQYRTVLNALMAHAIRVSTGKMNPPQTFVANPAPLPLNFKKKPFSSAPVTIPDWTRGSIREIDEPGVDGQGHRVSPPTAGELGLNVIFVGGAPVLDPEGNDRGDVVSVSPPPGTVVPRGSSVTVFYRG
jgi:PASTA domain